MIGNIPLQIKGFILVGRFFETDLVGKPVDNNHRVAVCLAGNLQSIKTGVLQVSAEIAAEIGNAWNPGQGGKRNGHGLGRARKLGDSAQRSIGQDQRIFRVCGG